MGPIGDAVFFVSVLVIIGTFCFVMGSQIGPSVRGMNAERASAQQPAAAAAAAALQPAYDAEGAPAAEVVHPGAHVTNRRSPPMRAPIPMRTAAGAWDGRARTHRHSKPRFSHVNAAMEANMPIFGAPQEPAGEDAASLSDGASTTRSQPQQVPYARPWRPVQSPPHTSVASLSDAIAPPT